jgi:hypothetical protein
MATTHEKLRLEHADLCAAHRLLKEEMQSRDGEARGRDGRWRTEDVSAAAAAGTGLRLDFGRQAAGDGARAAGAGAGAGTGVVVKIMICKGCFGDGQDSAAGSEK